MITCNNVQRILDLDFSSYLLLPQYSHSFLKNERSGFNQYKSATIKMQLGSLVDAILTTGIVDMAHSLYPAAKKIAAKLRAEFGWALNRLQKQVSYTGIMRYDAGRAVFEMPLKGRPDFVDPGNFIIDLKVTGEHPSKLDSLASFMGYPNQQFGYAKLDGCKIAYLLFYCTKTQEIPPPKIIHIGDSSRWWEERIIKFGKAV